MILGLTGHRQNKMGGYDDSKNKYGQIKFRLLQIFSELKPAKIISGMAIGVDQWAVEAALELKIPVLALIPCAAQESKWPGKVQERYKEMLADIILAGGEVKYISDKPYTNICMQVRNEAIVSNADMMLAVWDGSSGGTGNCVSAANIAKKHVMILDPRTMELTK